MSALLYLRSNQRKPIYSGRLPLLRDLQALPPAGWCPHCGRELYQQESRCPQCRKERNL